MMDILCVPAGHAGSAVFIALWHAVEISPRFVTRPEDSATRLGKRRYFFIDADGLWLLMVMASVLYWPIFSERFLPDVILFADSRRRKACLRLPFTVRALIVDGLARFARCLASLILLRGDEP